MNKRKLVSPLLAICALATPSLSPMTAVSVQQQGSKCERGYEDAPELRGLRLGMSVSDVTSRFNFDPLLAQEDISYLSGYVRPATNDVREIRIALLDNRIFEIAVTYSGATRWNSPQDFAAQVFESLNLPGRWRSAGYRSVAIDCQGFTLTATALGFRNELKLEITGARNTVARRRAEAEQRHRQAFRP